MAVYLGIIGPEVSYNSSLIMEMQNAKVPTNHLSRAERLCFDHLFNIQSVLFNPNSHGQYGYIVWVGFPQSWTQQVIKI